MPEAEDHLALMFIIVLLFLDAEI